MPELHWALLCQQVITDQNTNAVTYVNSVEEFGISDFPVQLPPITVATVWRREEEDDEVEMRVRVTGPFGEEEEIVLEVEQDFEEFDRYRINRGFQNLPVTGPGTINFYIEHRAEEGWELKKRIPLVIERVEGEERPENDEAALAE